MFTYDANPLVRVGTYAGPVVGQTLAMLVGVHPHILAPRSELNAGQIDRMLHLRVVLIVVLCAGVVLSMVLVVQVAYLVRGARRVRSNEPLFN